jgi:cell wall-associated NlpC family hydrolase
VSPLPGDFGLVSISGMGGFLVRIGQGLLGDGFGDFHHAFLVLDNGEILEAEPGGARIVPLSNYDGTNAVYSDWDLTVPQRADLVAAARPLVGTPYSWLDYLSLALVRFRIRPEWLKRYVADTGHLICSQLCDLVYLRAGLHMFQDGRDPMDVTPGDLTRVLTGPA